MVRHTYPSYTYLRTHVLNIMRISYLGVPMSVSALQEEIESNEIPHILTFNEIKKASERIEGGIIHTPLCVSENNTYIITKQTNKTSCAR